MWYCFGTYLKLHLPFLKPPLCFVLSYDLYSPETCLSPVEDTVDGLPQSHSQLVPLCSLMLQWLETQTLSQTLLQLGMVGWPSSGKWGIYGCLLGERECWRKTSAFLIKRENVTSAIFASNVWWLELNRCVLSQWAKGQENVKGMDSDIIESLRQINTSPGNYCENKNSSLLKPLFDVTRHWKHS